MESGLSIKHYFLVCISLFSFNSFSEIIAIVDSGTDVYHQDLASKIHVNDDEIRNNGEDDDNNHYVDDYFGWNFAENNNMVIDLSHLGSLTADFRKFFNLQSKMMVGSADDSEIKWITEKSKDEEFLNRLGVYGNFMHGTHVAGITMAHNRAGQALVIKFIPTKTKSFFIKSDVSTPTEEEFINSVDKMALSNILSFIKMASYASNRSAKVYNGSYGISFTHCQQMIYQWYQYVYKKLPSTEQFNKILNSFTGNLMDKGVEAASTFPNMLFVFAAGNDASDNDKFPTYPTNIIGPNVISVAATIGDKAFAPFSNYGVNTVDIAAPGVAIDSSVPGNQYLRVSGTSQAAPFISRVAAMMMDENPLLNPSQVKNLLMLTVDKKEFLKLRVKSGGLVNEERAILASIHTLTMSVPDAVAEAFKVIPEENSDKSLVSFDMEQIKQGSEFVMPLPSPFN